MNATLIRCFRRLAAVTLIALAAAGCSTTAMKGTPFFTGEYAKRTGPVENRVNLWPLFYYRDPALSVLWPLGEYTGDRLAIRPIFSIDNLDQEQPVYNVFWPLGRFDTRREDYRFFPLFWGDDHRVVFPLYWHFGNPFDDSGKGSDSLWPLWSYFRDQQQYSLHLLWPFFNTKSYTDEHGWRLWPLYGGYEQPGESSGYRYALWPLAWHTWDQTESTWTLLPLFHDARKADTHTFGTLLGGWQRDRAADTTRWYALPILGWGASAPEASRASALLGLFGHQRDQTTSSSRLIPLYYHNQTPARSLFLSPLYVASTTADGEAWRMVVPLALHRRTPHGTSLYTPLYSHGSDTETQTRWSCLLPLYYEEPGTFLSPLYSTWDNADGGTTRLLPPLLSAYAARTNRWDLWALAGLGHASGGPEGGSSHLVPLYYANPRQDLILTPIYAAWKADAGQMRAIPLLLSAWYGDQDNQEIIGVLGLFRSRWGDQATSDKGHLIPLYYYDHKTLLTPLIGHWENEGVVNRYWLTPLLGTRSGHARGSWLAPFYSHTADPAGASSHGWYLVFGEYRRSPYESYTHFPLLFEHESWRRNDNDTRPAAERDGWRFHALLLANGSSYDYLETREPARIIQSSQVTVPPIREPMHRNECGLFPLWDYQSDRSATGRWQRASGSLLLCLYDYRREQGREPPDAAPHDYTRRRVLFRIYHHERLNGTTSIDIFPGMTYDRDPAAGKRKFSLLWRLFRYEHTPENRAIDLLFLPIWRSQSPAAGS